MNVEQMFQALNDYIGNAKNPEQMIDDPEMHMIIGNRDFDKVKGDHYSYMDKNRKCIQVR